MPVIRTKPTSLNLNRSVKQQLVPVRPEILPHHPFRWIFACRSQMGKTTLIIKLLIYKYLQEFDEIFIFCPTFSTDNKWAEFDPYVKKGKIHVFGIPTEKQIQIIWKTCEVRRVKNKEYKTLIVIDDATGSELLTNQSNSACLNQFVCRCNHAGISLIISVQRLIQVSTTVRSQAEAFLTYFTQSDLEIGHIFTELGRFVERIHTDAKSSYGIPLSHIFHEQARAWGARLLS